MRSSLTKKLGVLGAIMLVIVLVSVGLTKALTTTKTAGDSKKIRVVTSFYPVYIATENVVKDMDNIELKNLASKQTGCLHDYTLTTSDMKVLEDADVFIMNGGGMESFVEDILKAYPDLTIIDTSKGVTMLEGSGHDHDHDHDHEDADDHDHDHVHEDEEESNAHEHDHGEEQNAHIWLDPDNYIKQIENIKDGLSSYDKANKDAYEKNAKAYEKKINGLKTEIAALAGYKDVKNKETIIFHDSFEYLLHYLGISVVDSIEIEKDTSLSAGDVAEIVNEIKEHDIKVLFTEKQFSAMIATQIGKETGAKVYVLDSLVSGDYDRDEYINAMKENISVLKKALFE